MSKTHDSSYKFLFSNPELVRDLIMGFIPDDWLHSLDYATLEKVPGSYISDDFQQREDDIVWRVKVGGDWLYLYLLIEFQVRRKARRKTRRRNAGFAKTTFQALWFYTS